MNNRLERCPNAVLPGHTGHAAQRLHRSRMPPASLFSARSTARDALRAGPVLLLAALAPMLPGTAAASIDSALARCSVIASESTRLACFDALAADAVVMGAEQASEEPAATTPDARGRGDAQSADPYTPETVLAPVAGAPSGASRPMSVEGSDDAGRPDAARRGDDEAAAVADAEAAARADERRTFGLRPYRRNYLLPVTYNSNVNRNVPEQESIDIPFFGDDAFDDVEMKFQISFEVPVWTRIARQPLDLYFGYTQLAFFQAYNQEYSSPFRETNYEPELGLHWQPKLSALGWRLRSVRGALNHQSNGRSEPLSRSWNRLTGEVAVERGDFDLSLRLWTLLGANPPDNPDIDDFLGYGELRAGYSLGKHHLGIMLRSVSHPTVQLDWSYPLGERLRVYAQYFNGFGESLLDYDHSVNRIGVGFMLNDRL
ncbi:MAG: phospholipase A [Thiohalocapsa sp.]|nr:phospholipase A [Thiohalocapsa sp.]